LHDLRKEKIDLKKYILLLGLCALILAIPNSQATVNNIITDIMDSSTDVIVEADIIIPGEVVVEIDVKPDTLTSSSKCKWVTCYIIPSEGYTVHDIDASSITLGELSILDQFTGIVDLDEDGVKELMVKFDRDAFIAMVTGFEDEVLLTLVGLYSDGVTFTGTDTMLLAL